MLKTDELFTEAMRLGRIEEVKHILKTTNKKPEDENNWAICNASHNGFLYLVEYLLTFEKVDPSARDNWAICHAFENGHSNIVEFLWQFKSVKNTLKDSKYIKNKNKILNLYKITEKLKNF
jgi:hypothetical protein